MIPFGFETVTLYHQLADGSIERHTLAGCSWRQKRAAGVIDGALQFGTEIICRYPPNLPKASPEDLFIRGDVDDVVRGQIDFAGMLEKYAQTGAFICSAFSDNTGVPLPHYCARG